MADDMQNKLERTLYKRAVFTCQSCRNSRQHSQQDVLQLMLGEPVACPSCGLMTILSEADRRKLVAQTKRDASMVRWLLIGAGLYIMLCIGLLRYFSIQMAGIALLGGLVFAWLISTLRSSRKRLHLELLPVQSNQQ